MISQDNTANQLNSSNSIDCTCDNSIIVHEPLRITRFESFQLFISWQQSLIDAEENVILRLGALYAHSSVF